MSKYIKCPKCGHSFSPERKMTKYPDLTDSSPMPWGKKKGVRMDQLPSDYVDFLMKQDWISEHPNIVEYFESKGYQSAAEEQAPDPEPDDLPEPDEEDVIW